MEEMRNSTIRKMNHNTDGAGKDTLIWMIMNLPRDIIFDILCRLPIESVLQCMSVCKLWSTFRYDSYFINLHFTQSMMHPPTTLVLRPSLLISPNDNLTRMSSLLMVSPDGEAGGEWKARCIPMGFELSGSYLDIVGSCNGILCIASVEGANGQICLFNPITRQRFMLPKSHLFLPPTNSRPMNIIGFGVDSLTMKYKVIRVSELPNKDFRCCEIITVGESSWRKLEGFPRLPQNRYMTDTVFLNGTFYWPTHYLDHPYGDYILGIDVDTEKSWTIDDCCPQSRVAIVRRSLIQIDGSLAIIDYHKYSMAVDVWLIKGGKTMGFSFTLTTYDMSGIYHWGRIYSVMAKYGDDIFLLNILRYVKGKPQISLLLYSPVKKQQYLYVEGGLWNLRLGNWMVPSLKALNL
ncbi:putative F-box protein At3g20705 [Macadamia integrifolia]|uniref:putative F-box protein At3g20705 n=1 Tax=Macadamia integrifolia TaxID=60698 RepID=UPI001C4E8606|nr:putative F-box protein At3g20705 [Macadamia integrifolia]